MRDISQFIVPLIFFALWALTWIFSRDTQPLPPRTGRPLDPNGPRPQPGLPPRMADRQAPGAQARPGPGRPAPRDDGIVILESEPRRPAPGLQGPAKRTRRAKPPTPAPPGKPEPQTPRALSSSISPSMAGLSGRPLELKPLAHSQTPLRTPEAHSVSRPANVPGQVPPPASLDPLDLRRTLASPTKVREGLVLGELLAPPLSLRRPRRGRP